MTFTASNVGDRPWLLVEVAGTAERLVIRFVGELDLSTARYAFDVTLAALQASDEGRLDIDMSALTFCDSTGIRTLMNVQRNATDRGGEVRLVNAQNRVRTIFQLVGLADALTVDEQRAQRCRDHDGAMVRTMSTGV